MSDVSKPSKPVRRKPLPTEAASEAPKPEVAKPRVLKPKVRQVTQPAADDDEFASPPARRLPPVVLGKKKKPKKKSVLSPEEAAYEAGAVEKPRSEVFIPLILIGVGLIANVATSWFLLPGDVVPLGLWLGIRMGMILISMVITYGALFLCAAVLDADYGYIDVGAVKVAAICLTQGWVGDLAGEIPVPFIGAIVAFGMTYAMFKAFFQLEEREVIASIIVVRVVHFLVIVFVFIAIMTAVLSGKGITLPGAGAAADAILAPEDEGDMNDLPGIEGPDEAGEMEP